MTLAVIFAYLGAVLLIGVWSNRRLAATGEDFFVAGRTIGPFVLLMTLFGTHMTSFALLGASAESYRIGIGVFSLMASSSALMVPIVFFFVGTRVWAVGKPPRPPDPGAVRARALGLGRGGPVAVRRARPAAPAVPVDRRDGRGRRAGADHGRGGAGVARQPARVRES